MTPRAACTRALPHLLNITRFTMAAAACMQHRHHLTEQARAVATALVQHDGFARGGCAVGASRAGAALSRARAHGGRADGLNVAAAHNKRCDDDVVQVKRQQFTAWHVTTIINARAQTVREPCWI